MEHCGQRCRELRVGLFNRRVRALEVHLEFGSHGRAQAVEELAELQAAGVVLKVARIEMVCDIEDRGPGAYSLVEERHFEALQDLDIDGHKGGKPSSLIALADEFEAIIDVRKRKAGSNFHRRRNGQSIWSLEFSIGEKTMRRVERQRPVLVLPNDQRRKITEKIIRRVQISTCA